MPNGHTFFEFMQVLGSAKVRYLVAGGMAVNLHGVPRNTKDLDLYIDLAKPNITRALNALSAIGLKPRIPVTPAQIADARVRAAWIKDKHMLVFQLVDPRDLFHPIDIFIQHLVPFAKAWKRRRMVIVEGVRVPLMSVADLITLKKAAGRQQDLSDIENLKRLEEDG